MTPVPTPSEGKKVREAANGAAKRPALWWSEETGSYWDRMNDGYRELGCIECDWQTTLPTDADPVG